MYRYVILAVIVVISLGIIALTQSENIMIIIQMCDNHDVAPVIIILFGLLIGFVGIIPDKWVDWLVCLLGVFYFVILEVIIGVASTVLTITSIEPANQHFVAWASATAYYLSAMICSGIVHDRPKSDQE